MTKLTKPQIKKLENIKLKIWEGLEELERFMSEIQGDLDSYSEERADSWHDSEAAYLHDEWYNRMEDKANEIINIREDMENLSFESILDRNYDEPPLSQADIAQKIIEANKNIMAWSEDIKELAEKIK